MKARFARGDFIGDRFLVLDVREGGMSSVYLTMDLNPMEMVCRAVKGMSFAERWDPAAQAALRSEAAAWVRLGSHPNVVRCFLMFEIHAHPYLLLEWVSDEQGETRSVREALREQRLSPSDALRVMADVCEAVRYCTERLGTFVHGDIKPENVLLGAATMAKLTDFGLARTRFAEERTQVCGTPAYMAPELWEGHGASPLTDIYAIGCMLYEVVEGRLPWDGATVADLRHAHLHVPPRPPDQMADSLWAVVLRCLAKQPAERLDDLGSLLHELDVGTPRRDATRESATTWGNRALTLAEAGRYDEALDAFATTLQMDPTLSRAYNNRAAMFLRMERYEDAHKDWASALQLDPDFVEVYANRAQAFLLEENLQAALEDARRAVELAPHWHTALRVLAQVRLAAGEDAEAYDLLERGLQIAPDDLVLRRVLLDVLFALRRWAEARELARELQARREELSWLDQFALAIDVTLCASEMGEEAAATREFINVSREDSDHAVLLAIACLHRKRPATALMCLTIAAMAGHSFADEYVTKATQAFATSTAREPIPRYVDYQRRWESRDAVLQQLLEQWPEPLPEERFVELLKDLTDACVPVEEVDPLLRNSAFHRLLERVLLPDLDKDDDLLMVRLQALRRGPQE